MNADILRNGPLPIRLFSMIGIIAGGLVGVVQLVSSITEPLDEQHEKARLLFQEFKDEHVVDWSRVDQVSNTVFAKFQEAPASDQSMATWRADLVASFEQDARQEFIRLALFFEDALLCVKTGRCHETDALDYFEGPICIFWNKTWPYFEHLQDRGVLFRAGVRHFVEQRNCRDIELEMLAHGKSGDAAKVLG